MAFPAAKAHSTRWLLFVACVILGTFIGIFFQHFSTTAPLFRDIVDFNVGVSDVDLLAARFGFHFGLRMNLGTFLGGAAGLFLVK
ncbi:MAG: hypothetical protein LBQ56_02350 [Synergistaceae bacterium]|jgi:hypothetical protein|nr:hypothetical protein [Synergistaceae bacterium]